MDNTLERINVLPPFSITFREALREYRERDVFANFAEEKSFHDKSSEVRDNSAEESEETEIQFAKDGSDDEAITLFPRRKAGQSPNDSVARKPLKLSVDVLENFYGMPLHIAARQLVSLFKLLDLAAQTHFPDRAGHMSNCNQESLQVIIPFSRSPSNPF
jgi:hypothetical protein